VTLISVRAEYDATPERVWSVIEPIESHVDWMADAELIRFVTDQTRGVGTRFECVTAIGPIKLTDRMVVTEWVPGRLMGVRHDGVVTGTGAFTITPIDGGSRALLEWDEELHFPWWLGGRLGAAIGGPAVIRRIWVANLARLRRLVEPAP
jgi:hypothetical protein